MDEIDREAMNLEFLMAQHRATPHKELQMADAPNKEKISVEYPAQMVAQIDRYRFTQHRPLTRSMALRELTAIGLAKVAADKKEAKR